ncbi:hypothetical protein AB0P36_35570 [Streptomyces flavidovirens]|uniref:hypothetical protein n=1 Tax=Streptomyces flavidovirens TaxID=67298 RepID=UPI00344591E1
MACTEELPGPALLEGGEVGVGLGDGIRVRRPLLMLDQGPVDARQVRVLAFAAAGGDD